MLSSAQNLSSTNKPAKREIIRQTAAEDQAYRRALGIAWSEYNAKLAAAGKDLESKKRQMGQLKINLQNLKAEKDRAWNRYIYTDGSSQYGFRVDNESTRLEYAQSMERKIDSLEDQISDLDEEISKAEKDLRMEFIHLQNEYNSAIAAIDAKFGRVRK